MFMPEDRASVEELIDRLGHYDRLQRVHAAAQLVRLGRHDGAVIAALLTALRSGQEVLQRMAALVLGDLAPAAREAIPPLINALSNSDAGLRRRAAVALGRFGAEAAAAVPALRSALADSDEGVRSFAATALALIEPPLGVRGAA
jgi:HEAT repeat protein